MKVPQHSSEKMAPSVFCGGGGAKIGKRVFKDFAGAAAHLLAGD